MGKRQILTKCVLGVLLGGAGALAPVLTSNSLASPPPPITKCSITVNNSTIYESAGDGPVMANFVIDTSETLLKPATYYIWAVGGGTYGYSYMYAIQQTSSASAPYQDTAFQISHSQLLSNATNNQLSQTAEPYTADIVITSGTSMTPVCQVAVTAAPNMAPSAPTNVTATAGDGQATVSWTAWKNFTGQTYTVTASPGGRSCTATHPTTSCTVTGLTNGTAYTFSVTNETSGGTSSASTASSPATPAAPTTTTVAPTTTVVSSTTVSGGSDSSGGGDGGNSVTGVRSLPSTGASNDRIVTALMWLLLAGGVLRAVARSRRVARG